VSLVMWWALRAFEDDPRGKQAHQNLALGGTFVETGKARSGDPRGGRRLSLG
jgi:hypothetical protein